jgi:prepilin-type N-terminal cleavage/methylation domain-containing protein
MQSSRMTRRCDSGAAAFTLIELLVVIAIIGLLAGLIAGVVFAVLKRTKYAMAHAEMRAISTALTEYHARYSCYPPDTGSWNEPTFDPESLHKYLCRPLVTASGRVDEAIMEEKEERAPEGIYLDPWGNPYQYDAMHVSDRKPVGWPYLPSRTRLECVAAYKIMSCGSDGITDPAYPFDCEGAPSEPAADDARSW